MEDKMAALAEAVFSREPKRRPEAEWIQRQAERLAEKEGIRGRAETDRRIFEKMYARIPEQKDTVKIRYWRTGRHLPTGREEALRFAEALGMGQAEKLYFMQACMEKSDVIFREPPEDGRLPLYRERSARILKTGVVQQIPSKVRTGERNGDAG